MVLRRPHSRPQAFTLFEVLLALFIFSIAVISLVEAVNSTGRTALLARRERQVQSGLEMKLLEATRSPEFLSKMRTTRPQTSTVQEDDVTFTILTAPLELKNRDGQQLSDTMSVKVTARWKEGSVEQTVTAETWIYPPLFLPGSLPPP